VEIQKKLNETFVLDVEESRETSANRKAALISAAFRLFAAICNQM